MFNPLPAIHWPYFAPYTNNGSLRYVSFASDDIKSEHTMLQTIYHCVVISHWILMKIRLQVSKLPTETIGW